MHFLFCFGLFVLLFRSVFAKVSRPCLTVVRCCSVSSCLPFGRVKLSLSLSLSLSLYGPSVFLILYVAGPNFRYRCSVCVCVCVCVALLINNCCSQSQACTDSLNLWTRLKCLYLYIYIFFKYALYNICFRYAQRTRMFSSTSSTKFSVYSLYYIFLWNSTSPNNMIVLVLCISEVSG